MITFQRELIDDCFEEMLPLFTEHWKEIAAYQDIPLDVDREKYYAIECNGALRIYTARAESKELIGYAVFFVNTNAHYKTSLQASQDVIFVHPKFRGVGGRLILWCDEQLRAEGVQVVFHHLKAKHNFGPMLERFGYELIDLIYGRRLDK